MPEKQPVYLIGSSLHIKHNTDTFFFFCDRLFHLKNDRRGKVFVPLILCLIILTNVDHAAQILDQASVRIICRCLVEKSTSIRVRIKYDLHRIDYGGLSASGMSGKKIDALV